MLVGVELLDAGARAVAVEESGEVAARAHVNGSDPAAAAGEALKALNVKAGTAIGVATANPDAPASASALLALPRALGDGAALPAPLSSGIAAAAAEAWIGAARGAADIVYFAVGEHAIGGILRGGRPVTGANNRGPAVAWLALNPVEREDYRRIGCLEAEVAGVALVRRLVWRIKAGDNSQLEEKVAGDLSRLTVEDVLGAARAGDGVSSSVVRDTARYLGMAAANMVAIADPRVLVLGGIMASAADLLFEAVRVEVTRRLPAPIVEALVIAPAALGDEAAAIGAARLAAAQA